MYDNIDFKKIAEGDEERVRLASNNLEIACQNSETFCNEIQLAFKIYRSSKKAFAQYNSPTKLAEYDVHLKELFNSKGFLPEFFDWD